jgi:ABC-type enterochelin transport system permease subunit
MKIQQIVCIAGLAQIALAFGSLAIPQILKWRPELAKVHPLIKQMFWTYAAYIFVINLCFGILSVFAFRDITNNSKLAAIITGFIALYWISRVSIQFLYFDRANFPTGKWHKLGEVLLVTVFVFLSITYSWAFYLNI